MRERERYRGQLRAPGCMPSFNIPARASSSITVKHVSYGSLRHKLPQYLSHGSSHDSPSSSPFGYHPFRLDRLRGAATAPCADPPAATAPPRHMESPSLPPAPTTAPAASDVPVESSNSSTSWSRAEVGLPGAVVAAAIVIIVIAVGWAIIWRFRTRRKEGRVAVSRPRGSATPATSASACQPQRWYSRSASTEFLPPSHLGPRRFSYEQLSISTNNFSKSELLGRGGFGLVHKGKLDDADGTTFVAVKCIAENSSQGAREFKAEVTIISDLRHRNLVKLKGWCHEHGKFLLVYDYMPNGSLDRLLFNDALCARLSWERRYLIAIGLGSALLYLHEECDNVIIHRDIKSSNVLLDEYFTAKLGDFGLSREMDQGITSCTTTVAGTRGYMAPECQVGGSKATRETDVYAFGTVLMELVSGKRALDGTSLQEHDGMLVDWVWNLHREGRVMEAVDERLRGMYDREEGRRVLMVGLACASPDPKSRPKIRNALEALRGSAGLPVVPLFKPTLAFNVSAPLGPSRMSTTSSCSINHPPYSSSSSSSSSS